MGTFSDALRALLAEREVSQRELARRLGLSAQAVNGWVTGLTTPERDNVVRVEDELAVDPRGSLLHLAGYSTSGTQEPLTVEAAIRSDPGLHPEDKRALLYVLRMARERNAQTNENLP